MKINVTKTVEANAKMIEFRAKLRDEGYYLVYDDKGNLLAEADSQYVPNDIIPGDYGDYVELQIDLETGQILNWVKPTVDAVQQFVEQYKIKD